MMRRFMRVLLPLIYIYSFIAAALFFYALLAGPLGGPTHADAVSVACILLACLAVQTGKRHDLVSLLLLGILVMAGEGVYSLIVGAMLCMIALVPFSREMEKRGMHPALSVVFGIGGVLFLGGLFVAHQSLPQAPNIADDVIEISRHVVQFPAVMLWGAWGTVDLQQEFPGLWAKIFLHLGFVVFLFWYVAIFCIAETAEFLFSYKAGSASSFALAAMSGSVLSFVLVAGAIATLSWWVALFAVVFSLTCRSLSRIEHTSFV